jgi:hypothetical protein
MSVYSQRTATVHLVLVGRIFADWFRLLPWTDRGRSWQVAVISVRPYLSLHSYTKSPCTQLFAPS